MKKVRKYIFSIGWTLVRWQGKLPQITLDDYQKAKIGRDDWRMLSTFMERLPNLTGDKRMEYSTRIAEHFFSKLELPDKSIYERDATAFLITVYNQVKQEWEI